MLKKITAKAISLGMPIALGSSTFLISTLGLPSSARADLRVCNNSSQQASVAFGQYVQGGWDSEGLSSTPSGIRVNGWWNIPPGNCSPVYRGDARGRTFYVYAKAASALTWSGDTALCIQPREKFRTFSLNRCRSPYEERLFHRIDANASNYTFNLNAPSTSEIEIDMR